MKSNGFTLLELVIIVIVISVLASLALPRFFALAEKVRVVEAIRILNLMNADAEHCFILTQDYDQCSSEAYEAVSLDDKYGVNDSGHFAYV